MNIKLYKSAAIGFSSLLLNFVFIGHFVQPEESIAENIIIKKTSDTPRYKIGPGDRLEIKVFQMDSFNKEISVLPDGTISLPRIGSLFVNELTLDETRRLITNKYKKVLKRPIVYINLVQARPLRITISGEVQRPGIYSLDLMNNGELQNYSGGGAPKWGSFAPTLPPTSQSAFGIH